MSFHVDLRTALSAVVSGRVYPQSAPADSEWPFIVYRVLSEDPLETLGGALESTNIVVALDCWGLSLDSADTTRTAAIDAIEASNLTAYRTSNPGEEYEPVVDSYVRPVYFGFWY